MNILVVEIDLLNSIKKYFIRYLLGLDFKNAYLRYKALDSLQIFGAVKSINDAIDGELYMNYFNNCNLEENICEGRGINNVLFLYSYLDENIKLNISNNIRNLFEVDNIIFTKEFKKM